MKTVPYKQFIELLFESARKGNMPVKGSFELTPLCNLDCKMCYVHLQDPSVKERMLSGKQWIDLMREAVAEGMTLALLTGGEALTHPDFWDIYMFLINSGISVYVKTNGVLLNREAIERFRAYPPLLIDISLYGCDSESYLAVTGKDAYAAVVENITSAKEAGLPLRLAVTPSRYMAPWTDGVLTLAQSFDLDVMVANGLIEPNPDTGRHREDFCLTRAEREQINLKRRELFPELHTEEAVTETERSYVRKKGLYCEAGYNRFAVNWEGILKPCLIFPEKIIGADALHNGFRGAWETVNRAAREFMFSEECLTCEFGEKCHVCPLAHLKYVLEHRCDPAVYAHWKRQAKEADRK